MLKWTLITKMSTRYIMCKQRPVTSLSERLGGSMLTTDRPWREFVTQLFSCLFVPKKSVTYNVTSDGCEKFFLRLAESLRAKYCAIASFGSFRPADTRHKNSRQ